MLIELGTLVCRLAKLWKEKYTISTLPFKVITHFCKCIGLESFSIYQHMKGCTNILLFKKKKKTLKDPIIWNQGPFVECRVSDLRMHPW